MERGRQTRVAILEAAVELLGRAGPDGFSAAALARAAGVSKATIFHHFASIDDIPLAAFDQIWHSMLQQEHYSDLALPEYLQALGEDVIRTARERRDFLNAYFAFFTRAIFDPRMRGRMAGGAAATHAALLSALGQRMPAGCPPERLAAAARLIEMTLDGLGLHLLVLDAESELRAAWALCAELISGLGSAQ